MENPGIGFPFFSMPQYRQNGTEKQDVSAGTGFIVSSDGYIVTNNHVVSGEGVEYTVFLNSGEKYTAQILATDTYTDLAVLKIDAVDLPTLELGDSDNLKPGQTVIAIGYALGEFKNTVSRGVISGLGRSIEAGDETGYSTEQLENIIQTDAAINSGNSGGPLLNIDGQIIGINVAMAGNSENIGFAIPINDAKNAIETVKNGGKIVHAYLGVRYIPVTAALKEKNQLSVDYGVLVSRGQDATELAVIPGSPADKAGLEENDIILEFDGQRIDEDHDLKTYIQKKSPGDKISLKILHDGEEKTVEVILEEMK
jgi:serine protease Do